MNLKCLQFSFTNRKGLNFLLIKKTETEIIKRHANKNGTIKKAIKNYSSQVFFIGLY
jgi:hypothetical protein